MPGVLEAGMINLPGRPWSLGLATRLGMPWRHAQPSDLIHVPDRSGGVAHVYPHSWSGRELLVSRERAGCDILHEIAHWLVSRDVTRLEFGLGDAPWSDVVYRGCAETALAHDEELAVCAVEISILSACGFDWRERAHRLSLDPLEDRGWQACELLDAGIAFAERMGKVAAAIMEEALS